MRAGLRAAQLRTAQLRTAELRTAELRTAELRTAELRTAELRTAELRTAELRAALRDAPCAMRLPRCAMRHALCAMRVAAVALTITIAVSADAQSALPRSQLGVRENGTTRAFWRSDSAPGAWNSQPLAGSVVWRSVADGVETAELALAGTGEAWRTRVILVRLRPERLVFSLDTAFSRTGSPKWNVDRAPDDAVFAMNAGQFRSALPWGYVVLGGRQFLPPERGPLAVTFAIDSLGGVHWKRDGEAMAPGIAWAFQSYPAILNRNEVPGAVRTPGRFLDVGHRDARLALGLLPDGALLVALTRFDGLGGILPSVPFGLTVPEMSAVMGALGATDAVLLDGGISAQLVAGRGATQVKAEGWRDVPLALIARSRNASR